MKQTLSYRGYCFPPDITAHAVWLCHRFALSLREIEDLLAERGITVSYETIRQWCATVGPDFARRLKKSSGPRGDCWFLDEVAVSIQGQRRHLWQAVDQVGYLIDILVQKRKDTGMQTIELKCHTNIRAHENAGYAASAPMDMRNDS